MDVLAFVRLLTERRDRQSALDVLHSFKGPITARRGAAGETFDVVSGLRQQASGVFAAKGLSTMTPLQRQQVLALPNQVKAADGGSGFVNNAIKLQRGTLTRDQVLLEGKVRSQGGQGRGWSQRDADIFGPTLLPGGYKQTVTEGGRFTGAIQIE